MRGHLILPLLLLLGTQPPSGDPPKPAAPVQEAGAETKATPSMDDLRAALAAKRYKEAAEGARGYLAANPEGSYDVVARAILCSARLDGHLPPPSFSTEPMKIEGDVRRPAKIYGTGPVYSERARQEKVNGVVVFEATIDHEGCVQKLRLLQGLHPDLDASARWAVEHWVFHPATLNGKPVDVYYALTVNFQVE